MDKQIEMTLNEIDQLPRDEWYSFDVPGTADIAMNLNQFHELAADYRAKVARVEELEAAVAQENRTLGENLKLAAAIQKELQDLGADYHAKSERLEDLEQFVRSCNSVCFDVDEGGDNTVPYFGETDGVVFQIENLDTDEIVAEGKDALDAWEVWKEKEND